MFSLCFEMGSFEYGIETGEFCHYSILFLLYYNPGCCQFEQIINHLTNGPKRHIRSQNLGVSLLIVMMMCMLYCGD